MIYLLAGLNFERKEDFAIDLAKSLILNGSVVLIDLDSRNRVLAEKLGVAEYTIYDIEDVLEEIVDADKAAVEVEDGLYLLSSSILDKHLFKEKIDSSIFDLWDNCIISISDESKINLFDLNDCKIIYTDKRDSWLKRIFKKIKVLNDRSK